jgi:two-component system NtrC family sensor kinase
MADLDIRARVLVIDDAEQTRYIFRRILTNGGFAVEEASTGAKGLEMAESLPDLIISDVNLPDMLGYDVCRRLRANPLTVSIPVLQISASFVSDESKVQALQGGADSYLTQPVEPTVLLAQVNALLRLRRAEASSNLSARQWRTTFDSLSDGVALVGPDDTITRVNKTFLEMLSFTASEVEGASIKSVFETRFDKPYSEFLNDCAEGRRVELSMNSCWFRVRHDSINSDSEDNSGSVLLITEITDHKKLQETVKMSERLAATGRLAHIIAHEINNPLEAMSNLLYLALQGTAATDANHEYLQQASAELVRISHITKQVLAYHRESKSPVLVKSGELIDGVLTMFRAQVLGSKIDVVSETDCTHPLEVHPGEIRQVFGNLISNGLDAIGKEGGHLVVRCFESSNMITGAKGVRFVFSDSGVGIPNNVIPQIFDAFYTTKGKSGSGIGLWLSAEVIEKHGGTIRLRTRTQGRYRGTLIEVFLPITAVNEPDSMGGISRLIQPFDVG